MHLAIGLGPIGGNIGAHLAELGQEVYGYDLGVGEQRSSYGTRSINVPLLPNTQFG